MPKKQLTAKDPKEKIQKKPAVAGSRLSAAATASGAVGRGKAVGSFSVPVYSLAGVESGNLELPQDLFGVRVNKQLLAQALRVYTNNLKAHFSNTKTRSEVSYSTQKLGPQKGSGHARHGSRGAPIYVGGGIALGPKFRKIMLELPKKMKKAALISALSAKYNDGEVFGLSGLEKSSGKTKEMQSLLQKINKKSTLFILGAKDAKVARSARNLPKTTVLVADQVNTWEIVRHKSLLLTKEAVEKLEARIKRESEATEAKKGSRQL